jgi:hypothetical protein
MNRNDLCACGSGRRYKHCHGRPDVPPVAAAQHASPARAAPAAPRGARFAALDAQRAGALGRAETLYRRALAENSGDVDALHMLGVVLYQRLRYREALDLLFDAAERSGWQVPAIRYNLGLVLGKLVATSANARLEALLAAHGERERARRAETPSRRPRVSVVVVAGADPAGAVEAIGSVAAQSYRPLELVQVDGAATAGSGALDVAVAKAEAAGIAVRRVTSRARDGAAMTNDGAAAASGDYLAFIGDGDRFTADRIETLVGEIVRDAPLWGFARTAEADGARAAADAAPAARSVMPASFALLTRDVSHGGGNLLVERGLFHALGGFRDTGAQRGWEFCVRAAKRVEPVEVDRMLYHRRADTREAGAEDRAADDVLADALASDADVANDLGPFHPANRDVVLRSQFRAGRGEHVPIDVLRAVAVAARAMPPPPVARAEVTGERIAVVVLGMHRSGTSALARVLSLCGAALPALLVPAKPGVNPTGFWEPETVNDLNQRLLRRLGADWNSVRALELPGDGELVEDFVADARRLIAEEYGGADVIVVKDPRIALLAPLWHRALSEAGYRAVYVVPVRHALEVARSLEARGDMPVTAGIELWLSYMERIEAFVDAPGIASIHVRYAELLDDWRAPVARIAAHLRVPLAIAGAAAAVERFLDPRLHNQRADDSELEPHLREFSDEDVRAMQRLLDARCERDRAATAVVESSR